MESPEWFNMIPKDREWEARESKRRHNGVSEEKKLELRLGPPGEEGRSLFSMGYFSSMDSVSTSHGHGGAKRGYEDTLVEAKPWPAGGCFPYSSSSSSSAVVDQKQINQQPKPSYLDQYPVVLVDEFSKPFPCPTDDDQVQLLQYYKDKMASSVSVSVSVSVSAANTAVPNTSHSQKRFTAFLAFLLFPDDHAIHTYMSMSTKKTRHIFPSEIRNWISILVGFTQTESVLLRTDRHTLLAISLY